VNGDWHASTGRGRSREGGSLEDDEWTEIVGVVGNVRYAGLDREPEPAVYIPYQQQSFGFMSVVVRAESDPLGLVDAVRAQVLAVDPDLPLHKVQTLEQIVGESVARPRFNMVLWGVFAVTAGLLAAVGIYGLMSYSVGQRTHEIGIRMAMPARATFCSSWSDKGCS
jgi:putative ABC transport system permease protein